MRGRVGDDGTVMMGIHGSHTDETTLARITHTMHTRPRTCNS